MYIYMGTVGNLWMDMHLAVKRALRIVRGDTKAIREAANDESATGVAVLLPILVGAVGIFYGLLSQWYSPSVNFSLRSQISIPILTLLTYVSYSGVFHIGAKMLGGKGTFGQLFRASSHIVILSLIYLPFSWSPMLNITISIIVDLWMIGVILEVVQVVEGISLGKTILIILLAFIVDVTVKWIALQIFFYNVKAIVPILVSHR